MRELVFRRRTILKKVAYKYFLKGLDIEIAYPSGFMIVILDNHAFWTIFGG
jgi:hypothetical protein